MGVITKPSSVQRLVIVRLLGACGMAAGYGGDYSQRSPREAVYRRHGLLPRAQHALLLTQTVHKKRAIFACPSKADASGSWQAYRITSSAWKSSVGGIVKPRAWAVLRLMTNSNLVGCST